MKSVKNYIIGIDEAGRGPLAGPVAVGVVCVPESFEWRVIPGVGDSKQISPKKREVIFRRTTQLQKEGKLTFAVGMVSAKIIDKIGIVLAIQKAMSKALQKVTHPHPTLPRVTLGKKTPTRRLTFRFNLKEENVLVKLDGGLKAPEEFINQQTIIRGDAKEKVIGLASIMAKVTRDKYMMRKSALPIFAPYTFALHKGYGTQKHRDAIKLFVLSIEHRSTFCKNLQK